MRKPKRRPKGTISAKENQRKNAQGLPEKLERDGFIYIKGTVTKVAHGTYKCIHENGLETINTARKLDTYLKISLIEGDQVFVEINPSNLSPSETVRGRIVFREKSMERR